MKRSRGAPFPMLGLTQNNDPRSDYFPPKILDNFLVNPKHTLQFLATAGQDRGWITFLQHSQHFFCAQANVGLSREGFSTVID